MERKKIAELGLLCLCALLANGCDSLDPDNPPYAISKPVSVAGCKEGYYNFAGIEFTLYNAAEREIEGIEVSCTVYDSETKKNPVIGSNSLHFKSQITIPPNSAKEMVLPLDPYVYSAPQTPWLIDFLYISSISYSDGSSWKDSTGAYYSRSY